MEGDGTDDPHLLSIGNEARSIAGDRNDPLYLYAEVEEDSVFAALFIEAGDTVHYHAPTPDLFRLLRLAWEANAPGTRWFIMRCEIEHDEVDATFEFPQHVIKAEAASDRCCLDITLRYDEDRTLLYPPLTDYRRREALKYRPRPSGQTRQERCGFLWGIILGQAALLTGGEAKDLFLFAQVGDRWWSVDLFREEAEAVRCHAVDQSLIDLVLSARELDPEEERWSIMELAILNDRFDAFFLHPGEVDIDSRTTDWRHMALRRRFGDKPVIYPSPSGNWGETGSAHAIHFCSP